MNTLPDNEQLARYLSGECSGEEKEAIKAWIREKPEHGRMMKLMQEAWQPSKIATPEWDTEKLWAKVVREAGIQNAPKDEKRALPLRNRIMSPRILRIAAALFLMVSLSYTYLKYQPVSGGGPALAEMLNVTVANGETASLTMADGSEVLLDAGSSFSYPESFSGKIREVSLDGEAYFKIAHNPEQPFIVHAAHAVVTVLGTEFNVSAWPGGRNITVAVSNGKVSLRSAKSKEDKSVVITRGQVSAVDEEGAIFPPRNADVTDYKGWMNRSRIYTNAPLYEIIDQVERWYDLQITLPGQYVADEKLTIQIRDETADSVLELIAVLTGMDYTMNGRDVRFSYQEHYP